MENLKVALGKGITEGTVNSKGYICSFLDNVYGNNMKDEHQKMFKHGSGSELQSKARAVHSSSMLGYNFFSWIDEQTPFVLDNVTYTKVYFEIQLHPLNMNTFPANMDIVLDGKSNDGKRILLFIESKFLEYTEKHKEIVMPISYTRPEKYYNGCNWAAVAEKMKEIFTDNTQYNEGLKQSFCHLVALDALRNNTKAIEVFNENNKYTGLQIADTIKMKILFANAIYCPKKDYEEERKMYDAYETLYKEQFIPLVTDLNHDSVQPQWFSYSEIWKEMESQINKNDPKRVEFLQRRYMNFAETLN
jgi:hypothetical protein